MAVSLTNRAEVLCQTRVEKVTSLKAHKHFFWVCIYTFFKTPQWKERDCGMLETSSKYQILFPMYIL